MYKDPLDERCILHNLDVDPVKLAFEMALSVVKKSKKKKVRTAVLGSTKFAKIII